MEPVTHLLTGACLARTGLNRRAAYATLTMAVAAEFPDIDTVWGWRGPVAGFQHHRGITHTFLGIPFEAALIVGGMWLFHRWRTSRTVPPVASAPAHGIDARPLTAAPVHWGLLYCFALLALLSHLWLDFTNNYGVRPFFPFNPHWYAASITFIFDPLMFGLLLTAFVLPPLFRLIGSEIGAPRQPFAARSWAVAALLGVCALWGWRAIEHGQAEQIALGQTYSQAVPTSATLPLDLDQPLSPGPPPLLLRPQRVSINPDPISPFRWYSATDFGPLYQLATVDLRARSYVPAQASQPKLESNATLEAAMRSPLGRAYLDWSAMPLLRADRDRNPQEDAPAGSTTVIFQDPRFLGENPWLHIARTRAPLTGMVVVSPAGEVIGQSMDGKAQR